MELQQEEEEHIKLIPLGYTQDFWWVYANKKEVKMILYAEMKLRGEAWQGFKIMNSTAYQTTAFRPRRLMLK